MVSEEGGDLSKVVAHGLATNAQQLGRIAVALERIATAIEKMAAAGVEPQCPSTHEGAQCTHRRNHQGRHAAAIGQW